MKPWARFLVFVPLLLLSVFFSVIVQLFSFSSFYFVRPCSSHLLHVSKYVCTCVICVLPYLIISFVLFVLHFSCFLLYQIGVFVVLSYPVRLYQVVISLLWSIHYYFFFCFSLWPIYISRMKNQDGHCWVYCSMVMLGRTNGLMRQQHSELGERGNANPPKKLPPHYGKIPGGVVRGKKSSAAVRVPCLFCVSESTLVSEILLGSIAAVSCVSMLYFVGQLDLRLVPWIPSDSSINVMIPGTRYYTSWSRPLTPVCWRCIFQ